MTLVPDNYHEIAKHINTGSTWKAWIFTCKSFNAMNSQKQIDRFSNHLLTLLKLYPDKEWSWFWLSENPNITWDIVQKNPQIPWDWYWLSTNPNITWDIVQANPDKKWSWIGLSRNPNITWKIVQANPQI